WRKQRPGRVLGALGAEAETLDVAAAARGTAPRHRLAAPAVVTLQPVQTGVVDQGHAAVRTLADRTAIAAQHEGRESPPVEKQNGLFLPGQRDANRRLELAAQRAELFRGELLAHVDHGDRRQGTSLRAVRELEQVVP